MQNFVPGVGQVPANGWNVPAGSLYVVENRSWVSHGSWQQNKEFQVGTKTSEVRRRRGE
jgi:hypothetical protein